MTDITLVIKIPEEIYEIAKQDKWKWPADDVYNAIKNGTPLPKGHGRLIDADTLYSQFKYAHCNFYKALKHTQTIIKADKE